MLLLSGLLSASLGRLIDKIASLGNYEIEGILNYLEINGLCSLDLSVDTDRNGLLKFHFEVGNLAVHKYLFSTLVLEIRALLIMRYKAEEGEARNLIDGAHVKKTVLKKSNGRTLEAAATELTVTDRGESEFLLKNKSVKYGNDEDEVDLIGTDIVDFLYDEMEQYLNGMTALATSATDPIAPAKIMKEYADKIECFSIKAGFIDGGVIDEKGVMELANIPSKEVLVCKIMGGMMSSLYGLAYVLQAKIDKDGGAAEEAAPAEEAPAAE